MLLNISSYIKDNCALYCKNFESFADYLIKLNLKLIYIFKLSCDLYSKTTLNIVQCF